MIAALWKMVLELTTIITIMGLIGYILGKGLCLLLKIHTKEKEE